MTLPTTTQNLYAASYRGWQQTTPWFRRYSARLGLQGKLALGFMFLFTVALTGSCWFFMSESRDAMDRVVRQQAMAISHTLAMASETSLNDRNIPELKRIGNNLLKNRGVIATAFYATDGQLLSGSTLDTSIAWSDLRGLAQDNMASRTYQLRKGKAEHLGRYLEVTTPVAAVTGNAGEPIGDARPIGFVTVCFSQAIDEAHLARACQMAVLIGATVSLISIPLVYGLVYRIFLPIRELMVGTNRIAAGHFDTQVAIHRPDIIGTLARSFNEMATRVRDQQHLVEAANDELARANSGLEQANVDLEEKVNHRTEQLEAANRRLKSEIAEKEDFLRAVSHDLNAPLRNIAGMATMLLLKHRQQFDDDIIHRLERIQKNVEVETDLITELLELSRIKSRRHTIEPVDVSTMIAEIGDLFENDLREREIRRIVEEPLPVLRCERARMRMVFQNLIDNAIKYMGNGAIGESGEPVREIHVGCVMRAEEVEFFVRDTGIGIEADDLDKVFYVFRRGRTSVVQSVPGKGVGLASVKSIVETHNGTIWVDSKFGKGSTFRFTVNRSFVADVEREKDQAA